jgi:hypothetical protein
MIDTRGKFKITTIMAEDWMVCTQASGLDVQVYNPCLLKHQSTVL